MQSGFLHKQYSDSKSDEITPSFLHFLVFLKNRVDIDKYIAVKIEMTY